MFCLGSCLYELMTLRGLPPADISQPEYSIMLQSGKRAQFHAKVGVFTYTSTNLPIDDLDQLH